jgi:hypothetical protein
MSDLEFTPHEPEVDSSPATDLGAAALVAENGELYVSSGVP